jgi:epoxyqueuosine reductase
MQQDLSQHLDVADRIRDVAMRLGFARVGIAPAHEFTEARTRLETWNEAGYAGEMDYLRGPDDRANPRSLSPRVQTLVCVALPYEGTTVALRRRRDDPTPLLGTVARYAVGDDYHRVLKDKLYLLANACRLILGKDVLSRVSVDTAPLLERAVAERAGIGFTGKSTMTIAPGLGTYFLLGELFLDVELPATPAVSGSCGRCTACIDACPTGAFVGPYVLDARRCISYLTIETKGAIPRELRPLIGTRIFGCDVCQDVCPYNGSEATRPAAPELAPRPSLDAPELVDWLELGSAGYRKLVRRSALRRAGRHQLQRNAAVALGNAGDRRAVPPLVRALETDKTPLVRAHAAWALGALGNLGGQIARDALVRARDEDVDATVREEATLALLDLDAARSLVPEVPSTNPDPLENSA